MTTTTYFVSRDSATATTDYDSAMAHASIATTETLAEAQQALTDYMTKEVAWLLDPKYLSSNSMRRAADINDGIKAVRGMTPKANSRTSIRTAGLVWTIARSER